MARLLPAGDRDGVIGDVEERWHARRLRRGSLVANAWYMRQVVAVPFWLLSEQAIVTAAACVFGVRAAVRGLLRAPRLSALMVITLGLAIGGTTAVFSVVDGVLLESLPYPESHRLVTIAHRGPGGDLPERVPHSTAAHLVYTEGTRAFDAMAVYSTGEANVTVQGGAPLRAEVVWATRSLFDVLRVAPVLGRIYTDEEDTRGAPWVTVLSHGLWRSRFGGDPSVIGRTIELNGVAREIVGVMPPGFGFPTSDVALWLPLRVDRSDLGGFNIGGIGRLAAGVTPESAERDLTRIFPRILEMVEFLPPDIAEILQPEIRPYLDEIVGDVRAALWVVLATVGFVLLIACANVANLLLARVEARRSEIGVRAAMGANRAHLFGLFLAEGGVLAVAAGALGLSVAYVGLQLFLRTAAGTVPRAHEIGIDGTVLGWTFAAVLLTTVGFALVPLLQARGLSATSALRDGGRGATGDRRSNRVRQSLIIAQVAFALVLLIGSGLTLRSFLRLQRIDPGFVSADVLTFRVSLPAADYPEDEHLASFHHRMVERLEAIAGVEVAGLTSYLPLGGFSTMIDPLSVERRPHTGAGIPPVVEMRLATAGYFEALGIPIVRGRTLNRMDAEARTGAVLISEKVARTFFEGDDPIGARIAHGLRGVAGERAWSDVVGVVGDVHGVSLTDQPIGAAYYPLMDRQGVDMAWLGRSVAYVVRASAPPLTLMPAILAAFDDADPRLPISDVRTLDAVVRGARARMTFTMLMLGIAAGMGLLLGAVGLYGVIGYLTERRTREIGVRLALGARPAEVRRLVMAQAAGTVAAGTAIGLFSAWALSRFASPLLYDIGAHDPLTFVSVPIVLVLVSMAATWLPARRASRMDPARALRETL